MTPPQRGHARPARRYTRRGGRCPSTDSRISVCERSSTARSSASPPPPSRRHGENRAPPSAPPHPRGGPPGRPPRLPERLRLPEVPDPGHEPLVEQDIADLTLLRPAAQARKHRLVVGGLARDVGPEPRRATGADELEDGAVPEDRLVLGAPQHEPGLASPYRTPGLDPPAAVHPQMAAQDEAALEPEQEILSHRLDRLEPPPVEPLGKALHR